MIEAEPCMYNANLHNNLIQMDTNTELSPTDQSVYGLVVFLVIFLLFATLTSGLLVCLTKIWCGFKSQASPTQLTEKQRQSILRSPAFGDEEDSEEESVSAQHTLSGRRFSQRIMSYVQKSLGDKKDKEKETEPAPVPLPEIYGAENVPTIEIGNASDGTNHDPSTIVHV
ncbi:unnamed protein product [Auanema sp. JU1783]|nr:unnamed protein product [Auanema sp. JU1783]